ncbi:MAG: hypothetical protein K9G70_14075 [Prolixibacteraceae bacterium]|nr:hypothetical protein [Prolixibacteraceae bacterium]
MPRKKEIIKRTEYISYRVFNLEKKAITMATKEVNMSISDFARSAALNMKVTLQFTPEELQVYEDLHIYHKNFKIIRNLIRSKHFNKNEIILQKLAEVIGLIKNHLKKFEQ